MDLPCMSELPVDIENVTLNLEINRLRREVDYLNSELSKSASIISSLSSGGLPSSSSLSLATSPSTTTATSIAEQPKFLEPSASSLNQLATILTLQLQSVPPALSSSSSSSSSSSRMQLPSALSESNAAAAHDIQNITLNLDIDRLSRERDYLRNELHKTQIKTFPSQESLSRDKAYNQDSLPFSLLLDSTKDTKMLSSLSVTANATTKDRRGRGPGKKKALSESALSELTTEESSHLLLALSQNKPKSNELEQQLPMKSKAREAAKAAKEAAKEAKFSRESLAAMSVSSLANAISSSSAPKMKVGRPKINPITFKQLPSLLGATTIPANQSQSLQPKSHAKSNLRPNSQSQAQSRPKPSQAPPSSFTSSWDMCSFIVKRLHTDVTNFKYNLKRKHHEHSITQLQNRYYICKVCYCNTRSIEVLHHASLDYVKFITLHFKKEHKELSTGNNDNDDYLPHIISIPVPKEIMNIINTASDYVIALNGQGVEVDVYTKMKSILNNDNGLDKKAVRKNLDEVLKEIENHLIHFKEARLDTYIKSYINVMPSLSIDVKKLLDAHASNYYAYFSAVEQKADGKSCLLLEDDYYDDIDNINDHINNNNRDNTTKIKKYNKVKRDTTGENLVPGELSLSDFSTPLFSTMGNNPQNAHKNALSVKGGVLIKLAPGENHDTSIRSNSFASGASIPIFKDPNIPTNSDSDSDSGDESIYTTNLKRKQEKPVREQPDQKKQKFDDDDDSDEIMFIK